MFLATADHESEVQSVLCFNRQTGKLLWQTPVHRGKRTHVWQTRVTDAAGKLLSLTVQTQMIL